MALCLVNKKVCFSLMVCGTCKKKKKRIFLLRSFVLSSNTNIQMNQLYTFTLNEKSCFLKNMSKLSEFMLKT